MLTAFDWSKFFVIKGHYATTLRFCACAAYETNLLYLKDRARWSHSAVQQRQYYLPGQLPTSCTGRWHRYKCFTEYQFFTRALRILRPKVHCKNICIYMKICKKECKIKKIWLKMCKSTSFLPKMSLCTSFLPYPQFQQI